MNYINWFTKIVCLLIFQEVSGFGNQIEIVMPSFSEPIRITESDTPTELSRNVRGSMAYDSQGILHLVYTERVEGNPDIGEGGLLYYRYLNKGVWNEPLAVCSDTKQSAPFGMGGNPALCLSPDGTVNFVWHDYRNSTTLSGLNNIDVYYRRLRPSGVFDAEEVRITSHQENQYRPKISCLPDGRLAIGWYDFLRTEGPDFLMTFSNENGNFQTDESFDTRLVEDANLDKEPLPGSHYFLGVVIPQFEFDSQGRLHAVWTTGFVEAQGTLNYGLMSSPPDRTMNPAIRISETGSSFFDPPKVRVDSQDSAWIVWTERADKVYHNICLAEKSRSESSFNSFISITDYDSSDLVEYPDIAIAPDGCVYVVWADQRDGRWNLFLRIYDPGEDQLSPEIRLTNSPDSTDTHPCIEISQDGTIAIVFESNRDGNTELYWLQAKIETAVRAWRYFE